MRRIVGALIVAAMFFAPGVADARKPCDSKLLVWSGTAFVVSGAVPSVACIHPTLQGTDARQIWGDHIMVTFDSTYLRGRPFVMVTLDGLGWKREIEPLGFDAGDPGTNDDIYKSAFLEIPHGVQANGCLSVTIKLTERRGRKTVTTYSDVQKYHTAGVTC